MLVRCVGNTTEGVRRVSEYWITPGRSYVVLSIEVVPEKPIELRILCNDGKAGLVDSRLFVTVCDKIPSNWTAMVDDLGILILAPAKWTRIGFWEDYYNGVPQAEEEFELEKNKIISES